MEVVVLRIADDHEESDGLDDGFQNVASQCMCRLFTAWVIRDIHTFRRRILPKMLSLVSAQNSPWLLFWGSASGEFFVEVDDPLHLDSVGVCPYCLHNISGSARGPTGPAMV